MSPDTFRIVVTIAVAIATLFIVVQAIVMIVLFRVATTLQAKVSPLIEQAKPLIAKIDKVAGDVPGFVTKLEGVMAEAKPFIGKVMELFVEVRPILSKVVEVLGAAKPIVENAGAIVQDLRPKIALVSSDVVEIVGVGKHQVQDASVLVTDFMGRARAKVERVDDAVDQTVEHVHQAGEAVKRSVLKPVRGVEGILAGVKAGIATYASGRRTTIDHITQDEEMFI
jgi:uncharacterized protein YoxC